MTGFLGVLWERAKIVGKIPEAGWKAFLKLVQMITAIVVWSVPDDWVGTEGARWVQYTAGMLALGLIFGAVLGLASAGLLIRDLMGTSGEQAASVAPAAPAAANAPAVVPETNAPSGPAEANAPAAPPAEANAPAVPATITVRGTFDESAFTSSGLSVVENSIVLELPRDGGPVTGRSSVGLDNFPIGKILASLYGGSLTDYPDLENCVSVVTLVADHIEGTYSPDTGAITGSATIVGKVEDRPCLSPLPPGMTRDQGVTPTTVTLNATFDGHQVQGTFSAPSGEEQKFQATVQ
jgi:hypothetical protein